MGKSEILLGSDAFMKRLEKIAAKAKNTFYAQAMTFEGDTAGRWLIDIMISSPAKDKKLLIDSYSKVVINDHFVPSLKFFFDKEFRVEIEATRRLIKEAKAAGIGVKFTNPIGLFGYKYPLRNHKKMVVIDGEHSFLGGINFSDHNFAWHDMMVSLADPDLGKHLTRDFRWTWHGKNQYGSASTASGELFLFNGAKSKGLYEQFFDQVREAKKSVTVISPYISEPLLGVLRSVAANGVKIVIISPQENNKSIFKNIILAEQQKGYFELKAYPGMSHMKAILIDDKKLVFGSSNYDLVSYYFEQEVVFVSKDSDLIDQFREKVLSDVKSLPKDDGFTKWELKKAVGIMRALEKIGGFASRTFLHPH